MTSTRAVENSRQRSGAAGRGGGEIDGCAKSTCLLCASTHWPRPADATCLTAGCALVCFPVLLFFFIVPFACSSVDPSVGRNSGVGIVGDPCHEMAAGRRSTYRNTTSAWLSLWKPDGAAVVGATAAVDAEREGGNSCVCVFFLYGCETWKTKQKVCCGTTPVLCFIYP